MNELLTRETILDELKRLKPELGRHFGVLRIGLFGSFVRGDARADSDIDVVIELSEPDIFTLVHVKETLEKDFNRKVDVIPFGPLMNSYLKNRILSEAVYV